MRITPQGPALPLSVLKTSLNLKIVQVGNKVYWVDKANVGQHRTTFASTSTVQSSPVDGVTYQSVQISTANGTAMIDIIKAEDFEQRFALRPLLPENGIGTLEPLSEMTQQPGVVAAINANFFDPASKLPIGLLLDDNQLQQEDYAQRGALGVDMFGKLHFLNPGARASVNWKGQLLDLNGLNRSPKSDELIAFTSAYEQTLRFEKLATVVRIVNDRVTSISSVSVLNPDQSSNYIVATGDQREILSDWQRRDVVKLEHTLIDSPEWPIKYAISAGPMLIHNGAIVLDAVAESFSKSFASARAARSVIGLTADGALMFAIVNKHSRSVGMTLDELAKWMQSEGAVYALALDGGGSSSLSLKEGARWTHLGGTRPVAVGLALLAR
jgi:hypothetical protein